MVSTKKNIPNSDSSTPSNVDKNNLTSSPLKTKAQASKNKDSRASTQKHMSLAEAKRLGEKSHNHSSNQNESNPTHSRASQTKEYSAGKNSEKSQEQSGQGNVKSNRRQVRGDGDYNEGKTQKTFGRGDSQGNYGGGLSDHGNHGNYGGMNNGPANNDESKK